MLLIPIGQMFSSTIQKVLWRSVKCEHCGCDFLYRDAITIIESGLSPLSLINNIVKQRVENRAQRRLKKRSEQGTGIAPCPECGKFQTAMIRKIRSAHHVLLTILVGFLIGLYFPNLPLLVSILVQVLSPLLLMLLPFLFLETLPHPITLGLVVLGIIALLGAMIAGVHAITTILTIGFLPFIGYAIWYGFIKNLNANVNARDPWRTSKYAVIRRTQYEEILAEQRKQADEERKEAEKPFLWPPENYVRHDPNSDLTSIQR